MTIQNLHLCESDAAGQGGGHAAEDGQPHSQLWLQGQAQGQQGGQGRDGQDGHEPVQGGPPGREGLRRELAAIKQSKTHMLAGREHQ